MSRTTRTLAVSLATFVAAAVLVPAAAAHDEYLADGPSDHSPSNAGHQHGTDDGHLPASKTDNVKVVSKTALKNVVHEKIADVGVHDGYAYLAAWGGVTCKYNGIHVVDIRDVSNPREVAFIQSKEGSAPGEGIQALHIDTPYFDGELLVSNNEKCKQKAGFGGMNIYDVSRPRHPVPLAEGVGDFTVNGQGKKAANDIHSVFAWDAGERAYAVIVDNEEAQDVDIVDITNPKKAHVIAEYDLAEVFPQIVQDEPANLTEVFSHDMVVKEIDGRQMMLMSYWDGGYVTLDVTDPRKPLYVGDSDFGAVDPEGVQAGLLDDLGQPVVPEGNAHQAEFTGDNKYIVASDEDFGPEVSRALNVTDDTALTAFSGSDTTPIESGDVVQGRSVFVGRACPGDPAVPPGDPQAVDIAVVERGVCFFTEKVTSVVAAGGYDAILIFNREGSDACEDAFGMDVAGDLPTVGVAPRSQGFAIFDAAYDESACLAGDGSGQAPIALGTQGDVLRLSAYFDGWGYVHLYRNQSGKLTELDTYAVPEAVDPDYASGYGALSVHEVAASEVVPSRLYFSYYSAGFRVAEIEGGRIVEKGHYIAQGGNDFWGVQVFQQGGKEYVAASDRDSGLWIFRYRG